MALAACAALAPCAGARAAAAVVQLKLGEARGAVVNATGSRWCGPPGSGTAAVVAIGMVRVLAAARPAVLGAALAHAPRAGVHRAAVALGEALGAAVAAIVVLAAGCSSARRCSSSPLWRAPPATWVLDRAPRSLAEIETATLRLVALRQADGVTSRAAKRLGMSHVALSQWLVRRRTSGAS